MAAEEGFTAAEVSMEAEVFMVEVLPLAARTSMAAIMPADIPAGMVVPAGTVVLAGTAATTDGVAGIGVIRATAGVGDGALALGGRIVVGGGDTPMATMGTARGTTLLLILIIIRTLVLRVLRVHPRGTMTLLHRITAQNPEVTRQSPGGRRQALPVRTTGLVLSRCTRRALRFSQLTG